MGLMQNRCASRIEGNSVIRFVGNGIETYNVDPALDTVPRVTVAEALRTHRGVL